MAKIVLVCYRIPPGGSVTGLGSELQPDGVWPAVLAGAVDVALANLIRPVDEGCQIEIFCFALVVPMERSAGCVAVGLYAGWHCPGRYAAGNRCSLVARTWRCAFA